jgi:hypothetical protein
MTNTANPYRIAPPLNPSLNVEVDDVVIDVFYRDIDDTPSCKSRSFIGSATATKRPNQPSEAMIDLGSAKYWKWLHGCMEQDFFTFEDLMVPVNRLLKIEIKKTTRSIDVIVEVRNHG